MRFFFHQPNGAVLQLKLRTNRGLKYQSRDKNSDNSSLWNIKPRVYLRTVADINQTNGGTLQQQLLRRGGRASGNRFNGRHQLWRRLGGARH
jgi:hypothetical protein